MEWALGNSISIRTIAVGCAVVTVVSTMAIARPKMLPLPHLSFSIGATAPAADPSVITISSADAGIATGLVSSIDDVHSQQDLVSYADYLMQSDSRITQIQVSPKSVSMTYETSNRLLNVRSLSSQTTAIVTENGTVSISGSWLRPLFAHVAQASSPDVGFSDISLMHDYSGLAPATEARVLARMHGRFQIGAIQ